MKKKTRLLLLLTLCLTVSLCGCRKRVAETETETETASETETETEKESETEKETKKETEKSSTASNKNTNSTEKTTVKPSTVKSNTTSGSSSSTKPSTSSTTPSANNSTTATQMCPYCYQQISTASNGDGTTVYSVHVAQEKAWADTYGYGTETTQQSTEAPAQNTNDVAQCPYCYQWFTVSDGSYDAHLATETGIPVNVGGGTEYVQCPNCGNLYPAGNAYETHVCPANQ